MTIANDDAKYQHPEYVAALPIWRKIRDCVEGEEAVKVAGETYLPKVSDHQSPDEYNAYKDRAMFFNGTGRTVEGLLGAIFRKPTVVETPDSVKQLIDDADGAGTPIQVLVQRVAEDILKVARFGVLVDMPEVTGAKPETRLVTYCAESIWDWRVENKKLSLVVLHEKVDKPGENGLGHAITEQLLVLRLTANVYTSQRYERQKTKGPTGADEYKWVPLADELPTVVRGATLDYIPFTFFAASDLSIEIEKSKISDLVNTNLSHYRTCADYEHGAHFTALPTPVAIGADPDDKTAIGLGPTQFIKLPTGADAKMLEFSGKGLETLAKNMDRKENMMVLLGARLLEVDKAGVEAAETHRIRHSGENSILASIADVTGRGIKKALETAVQWAGASGGEVKVQVNKDFFDMPMSPQMLEALLKSWMAAGISKQTYLTALQRGEILPDGITPEEEMERIAEDLAVSPPLGHDHGEDEDGDDAPAGE